MLDADVGPLDAVVYTHTHADHVHGIDDLRMIVFNMRERLPVWADGDTSNELLSRFGYAFVQPEGSAYPPICELNTIDGDITIGGAGGDDRAAPVRSATWQIDALGFRIADVAYLPDVSAIPDDVWPVLQGLGVLDRRRAAPRAAPDPRASGEDAGMDRAGRAQAGDPDQYAQRSGLCDASTAETPDHIHPAYDGMS